MRKLVTFRTLNAETKHRLKAFEIKLTNHTVSLRGAYSLYFDCPDKFDVIGNTYRKVDNANRGLRLRVDNYLDMFVRDTRFTAH